MCDIWKRPAGSELSLDNLRKYQDSIRKLEVRQIVLTGGEPLLHSRFDQLCALLKECGVKITLLTTGLLLQKRLDAIVENVDEIIVSLDGPESIHNSIRHIAHAYRLLRDGISAIKMRHPKMPIHARSTVQRENFRYLRQTVQAAKQIGCDSISFLAVDVASQAFNRELVWPDSRRNEVSLLYNEVEQLAQEVELLIRECAREIHERYVVENPDKLHQIVSYFRQSLGQHPPQAPKCNAPWVSAVVEVDGSVRPCFFHERIGHAAFGSLAAAINGAQAQEFRQNLDVATNPVCQRCVCSLNYRSR
jgi:MoaA/NifB/PqqE/SkfB family radical SAM enzyme